MSDRLNNDDLGKIRAQFVPNFRFGVEIAGVTTAVFTECTLPTIEWEIESVKVGGINNYVHELPGRRKNARLTLKNGLGSQEMYARLIEAMSLGKTFRRKIDLHLWDANQPGKQVVMTWSIQNAFPIKWRGPQLKSSDNTIAIASVEFACGDIVVEMKE